MKSSTVQGIFTAFITVCLTLLGLEIAVRIHRGKLFEFTSDPQSGAGRMAFDNRLGWVSKPGRFSSGWTANVDASSVRSNGGSISTASRPILAIGDSFTFGDEVEDNETWAAHLERILNKRVLNAGVGAYGIDQDFLRAELLVDEYDPDVVILSFISDDINRTEYSYYPYGNGWKPYFEYKNGSLTLRNVPVPQALAPRGVQPLRRALSYSLLADAIIGRLAPLWWRDIPTVEQVHHDGENVSVELIARLDALTKKRGGQFIAIAMATNGLIGSNARLPGLVQRLRERRVEVLDLSTEVLKLQPSQLQNLFLPGGHYTPAMNIAVAEHIAAFLRERGLLSYAEQPRSIP